MFTSRKELKKRFEADNVDKMGQGVLLKFEVINSDYDVYNCSAPFEIKGEKYIFGRVEKYNEWASSKVMLFKESTPDTWEYVKNSGFLQLEDPFVAFIHGELVLGGTHVRKVKGKYETYSCYFYKVKVDEFTGDLGEFNYFTSGPMKMKDIRLIELSDGKIGVFSRPSGRKFNGGAYSAVGFAVIDTIDDLCPEVVENAEYIESLFGEGEWGGVNQVCLLDSGKLGVMAHISFNDKDANDERLSVYCNCAFVFDPETRGYDNFKIVATKSSFPACKAKIPRLEDCCFTSGVFRRPDGKYDLYSGIGDVHEGRMVIDNPFEG